MEIDKKRLFLIGISVFALFIMGVGLAFRSQFKEAMATSSSDSPVVSINTSQ